MKKLLLICSLLLTLVTVTYAQENRRDTIIAIFDDKNLTPEERVKKFDDYYCVELQQYGYEESEVAFFYEIVFPFIDKEIKESARRNHWSAVFHDFIADIYKMNENFEKEREEFLKAIDAAEKLENSTWKAYIYGEYGIHLVRNGDVKTGHEYIYKAISLSNELGDSYRAIVGLWYIAVNFQEIRDAEGLKRIIDQMESYSEASLKVTNQYRINSLKSAYYDILLDKDPDNELFKDSSFIFSKKNIFLIENNIDELYRAPLVIVWDYYNHALVYQVKYPENYDSILYYLNKTLEIAITEENSLDQKELEVSVYIAFAEIHFKQKLYEQAEKEMLYALTLSEELKDQINVIAEFHEIYKFLVMYYETMNRPAEALKYQKLLQESEKKRYDNEKIQAINDMSVKYETEKKEAKIAYLELENQTARRIIMLVAALLVLLVIAVVFIVINNRLRKKNLEQSIYETALLNELQQTELEKTEDEKQLLQQEYDKLNELAGESQKKAEEYAAQLQSIKQQLEQKPTQSMANKIKEMVSKSLIDSYHKKEYIENLSKLDIDMLEQGFLTADEKISNMDMKYIICFAADMEVKDISLIFNVEPASVRTVRYRIKKKFQEKNTFKFLI